MASKSVGNEAVTVAADFNFMPLSGACLMAVRPGIPKGQAISEAQALLSAARAVVAKGIVEPIAEEEAHLASFAMEAAMALYRAAGAAE